MFRRLFQKKQSNEQVIRGLYGEIVAQARQEAFYADYGVPDSLDGRFNMIVLHCFLLFYRLKNEGDSEREISQAVFDLFRLDMDRSLRELGVGDTTVPKRMKKMMQVFYGRTQAYDKATEAEETGTVMADALQRNILSYNETLFDGEEDEAQAGNAPHIDDKAAHLAQYVFAAIDHLNQQKAEKIASGSIKFPKPETGTAAA